MSGKEENLKKQARRMNQPIPDRIANKPILKTGLCLYFDAFLELQYDRTEQGYIPWSIKIKYAKNYGFDNIQTENLIYLLSRLDESYKKWSKAKGG